MRSLTSGLFAEPPSSFSALSTGPKKRTNAGPWLSFFAMCCAYLAGDLGNDVPKHPVAAALALAASPTEPRRRRTRPNVPADGLQHQVSHMRERYPFMIFPAN